MGLSNEDWNRLDRMRSEDRDHLDSVTEKLDSDSVRQWQHIAALRTDLEVHKQASAGAHDQPCETAMTLQERHDAESVVHNPKKMIPLIAGLFTIASIAGAWLFKFVSKLFSAPHAGAFLLVVSLAAASVGCSTKNTVLEEDRVLIDLTAQIIQKQAEEIGKLEIEVDLLQTAPSPFVLTRMLPIRDNLRHLNEEAAKNLDVFKVSWGGPGVAQLYSDEVNAAAREKAKTAHEITFWGKLGAALLAGGAAALAAVRSPIARMIPGIGPIFASFDSTVAGIEKFMADRKAKGDVQTAIDLGAALISEQQMAKVEGFVTKRLDKVKKKIAPALDAISELTATPGDETKVLPATGDNVGSAT